LLIGSYKNIPLLKEYITVKYADQGKIEQIFEVYKNKVHDVFFPKSMTAQFGGYFMQLNVPWGIYGIHGTDIPSSISHSVSHGCIRMYSSDAKELYNIILLGTNVNIY